MRRVEVKWFDSMMLNYGEWAEKEQLEDAMSTDALTHRSCGYLVSENDNAIMLSVHAYEGNENLRVAGAATIPKVAILSMEEL